MTVENQTHTLKTMLDNVDAEIGQTEERLVKLKQRRETLRVWLAEERPLQVSLPLIDKGSTPLSVFLRMKLSAGKNYRARELGVMAQKEGLIDEEKSPGRVVHFALVGLEQHDYVKKHSDGTWSIKK